MNRLIAAVAAHPVLYATSKRQLKSQEVQQQRFAAWAEIAKKLKYTQPQHAESAWETLIQQYTSYLLRDTPFAYRTQMGFMQKYLVLKAGNSDDDDCSDEDLDYQALERAMEMDDDDVDIQLLPNKPETSTAQATQDSTQQAPAQTAPTADMQQSNPYLDEQSIPINGSNQYQTQSVDLVWSPDDLILVDESQLVHVPTQDAQAVATAFVEQWNTAANNAQQAATNTCQQTNTTTTQQSLPANDNSHFKNFTSNELIFLGYAKTVSQMPMPLQLKTKRKIAEVMENAEMELMNAN